MAGNAFASFTVDSTLQDSAQTAAPTAIGPLTLTNLAVSLVGTTFKDGKLALTIGIGADSAELAFGRTSSTAANAPRRAAGPARLADAQRRHVEPDRDPRHVRRPRRPAQGRRRARQPGRAARGLRRARRSSRSTWHVPGDGAERGRRSPAAGLRVSYDENYDPAKNGGKPQEILRLNTASVSFPSFGITGLIQPFLDTNGNADPTDDTIVPGLS